jgi:LuxR family transcriptional regulator, maltose regulon positive regulatory protein
MAPHVTVPAPRTASRAGSARPRKRVRPDADLTLVEPGRARPFEVFESKLCVTELRPGTVSRTGLVNQLRAEHSCRLATVVAASGYGKTTLLAQWAARDERPFAWLSVDEHDNDPLILLRHLAVSFDRVEPLDASILGALAEPGPSVWSAAAPALATAFSSCPRPFVAVLDNADLLHDGESADAVLALADSVPAGSMLVLAGRVQPPLPIARLRASGALLELGTSELALSRREAQLLLRDAGPTLEDEISADLLGRTEGWAAGLYLAARALDEGALPKADAGLGGRDRYISQYFNSEHLSRLTPERREFLRRTSVLEHMCGPLCDAVLASENSAVELEAIEQSNLFVVPLDREGGSYRYHHLFRDALRRELEHHEPALVPVLHERAADWFEAHGDLESALDHAESAGDARRAARILTAIALPVYYDGRIGTVERWLERFPAQAALEAYPSVAVLGGWVHALNGHAPEAERSLAAAQRGPAGETLPDGSTGRPLMLLLRAAMCADGVERMEQDVDAALAELPADSQWLPTALVLQGAASALRGDLKLADERLATAAEAAERLDATDAHLVAISKRSLLAAAAGDHGEAERLALEARELLAAGPVEEYVSVAIVRAAAARAFLRHGRWDDARRELVAAERLAGLLTHALPWFAVETRLALGAAYLTLRDRDGVRAQLAEIEKVLAVRPGLGVLVDQVADLRGQIDDLPKVRDGRCSSLTAAELRLLPLLATHLSFREIGERLYVSRNTIKTQAISAYRKLGVSSRSAAIERASELGLVDDVSTSVAGRSSAVAD